jgi:hypothetical protein
MTVRVGFPTRCLAASLLALTAALSFTAVAEGWRRPATVAISSPEGGEYSVCRDGVRFQIAFSDTSPRHFEAYSPPPDAYDPLTDQVTGGTLVAEGDVSPQPLTDPALIDEIGATHLATVTQRWAGGRLLQPSTDSFVLVVTGVEGNFLLVDEDDRSYDDVQDCYLFRPPSKGHCDGGGWRSHGWAPGGWRHHRGSRPRARPAETRLPFSS